MAKQAVGSLTLTHVTFELLLIYADATPAQCRNSHNICPLVLYLSFSQLIPPSWQSCQCSRKSRLSVADTVIWHFRIPSITPSTIPIPPTLSFTFYSPLSFSFPFTPQPLLFCIPTFHFTITIFFRFSNFLISSLSIFFLSATFSIPVFFFFPSLSFYSFLS